MREVEKSLPNYSARLTHVKGWREERMGQEMSQTTVVVLRKYGADRQASEANSAQ